MLASGFARDRISSSSTSRSTSSTVARSTGTTTMVRCSSGTPESKDNLLSSRGGMSVITKVPTSASETSVVAMNNEPMNKAIEGVLLNTRETANHAPVSIKMVRKLTRRRYEAPGYRRRMRAGIAYSGA